MSMPDVTFSMSIDTLKSSSIITDVEQIINSKNYKDKNSISLFEVLKIYQEFRKNNMEGEFIKLQFVNSIFHVNISNTCVYIYRGDKHVTSDFRLILFWGNTEEFFVKCKCEQVCEILKGREQQFIENLFVKIGDCPEWMHNQLKVIRQDQLKGKQKWKYFLKKIFRFKK